MCARILQLAILSLLCLLLVALAWLALQIARIGSDAQAEHSTMEARRPAYQATGTALVMQDQASHARIWRMQQQLPTASYASASAAGTAPSPTEALPLPQLLVPLEPPDGSRMQGTAVPRRVAPVQRYHPLVNIMLLGSDGNLSDKHPERTDTMILVSLNLETRSASMLSLPRDLLVYIPSGRMGRLNGVYGTGEALSWSPGGGFGLLRQTLFYNFGINAHYYAMVDFSGFEALIDRLGGVDVVVECTYQDYYPVRVPDQPPSEPTEYQLRTLSAGLHHFSGYDALWYARTRKRTDDIDRGRRQQKLLRAIWQQASQLGLLAALPQLWGELQAIIETDVPLDMVLRLLPTLLALDPSQVDNMVFLRNVHSQTWTMPSGAEVQLPKPESVAALMQTFYLPPPNQQIALQGPTIAVRNASGMPHWDIIASERLRWDGLHAFALDTDEAAIAENTVLYDYVATEKGSLVPRIARAMRLDPEQVIRAPDAQRSSDYELRVGQDFQGCTHAVLPILP